MRRAFIIAFLSGILGTIVWWLLGLKGQRTAPADPWAALPVNAAVVLEVPDPLEAWSHFTSTSQQWTAWDSTPGCALLNAVMLRVRDAAGGDPAFVSSIGASTLLVALSPGGESFSTLIIWPLAVDRAAFAKLGPALGADLGASSPLWRDGRATMKPDPSGATLHLGWANDLLLISDDADAITDALNTATSGIAADSLFSRARASLSAGTDAHLLLHIERGQRLATTWLKPEALASMEGLRGWAALDLKVRPEAVLLSGLFFTSGEDARLRAMAQQPATKPVLGRVLPTDVHGFEQYAIEDARRFSEQVVGAGSDEALFEAYGAWANGAIGAARRGSAGDSSAMHWVIVQAGDPQRATEALTARCATACDTLGYRNVRITRCADTSALASVWGDAFADLERPWYCVLNDKVVFAEELNAIRASIDAWTDGASLAQDPRTSAFMQRYASDAAFTWWADAAKGLSALRPGMKQRGLDELELHRGGWERTGGCLVQVSPEHDGVYQVTACFAGTNAPANGGPADDDGALWSVSLGAKAQAGPFLLTDHLSRTEQVLVQDDKQRIALISCTGKILWQRGIDGPIIGEVHQVDRFKNGKLQMLFNTATRIHLIDRNGRDVAPFPLSLPEKASAPLNVFDYEGNKEYRVLVPTEESRLLNFGMDGKAVQGWDPPRTPATCSVPVEHLRIRGKDYLVLTDRGGQVTVLDRRGEQRYAPKLFAKDVARLIGIVPAMEIGDCQLLWEDEARTLVSGRFDGAIDTLGPSTAANVPPTALRYPLIGATEAGADRWVEADINLDGSKDRVMVTTEGRVSMGRAAP